MRHLRALLFELAPDKRVGFTQNVGSDSVDVEAIDAPCRSQIASHAVSSPVHCTLPSVGIVRLLQFLVGPSWGSMCSITSAKSRQSIIWPHMGHFSKWSASLVGVHPSGLPGFLGGGVVFARRVMAC